MGYDANIAAPLIFSQPGRIKPNQLCAEPVNGVDIVQTFHSIAGIKPVMELHGRDMVPLLEKPSAKLKEPMLLTHTARLYGEKFLEAIKGGIFVWGETQTRLPDDARWSVQVYSAYEKRHHRRAVQYG